MSLNTSDVCEKLVSGDRREKILTLELLQQTCLDNKFADSVVMQIFDECYLNLLKCYSDRYESVRDQAIISVSMFVDRLPPNDFHLLNIISTLVDRMGQVETIEESEEIRLSIMHQLLNLENKFITTGNKSSLIDCYKDIVRISLKAMKDSYPSVQREACACIVKIAECADTCIFNFFAENLAKGLYGMLNHKHSQSRIAAVKALGYIALHIDASGDQLSRLIMEISPLLMDSMPLVRRECGVLGVRLLLELRDRYSYFERIIPLVLCCLKDDSPEVQSYIMPLWEKCGKQYYDENYAELSKQETADFKPLNYPENLRRPIIGCRAIVQRSKLVLKLIMREANDWKENVRLHSLKLLFQFILHAEAAMTANFFEIYGDIAKALMDVEPAVVKEAVRVSDLMGRLLNYDDWYEHGFEGLEKHAKEGYLKCFYYMYTASLGVKFEHNFRLSKILTIPELSQTLNPNLQMYVLKTNETILDKCGPEKVHEYSSELYKNCYCSTIKVMSLCLETEQTNSDELQTKAKTILLKISEFCKCNEDELHEKFFIYALDYVQHIDTFLDAFSEPILLLYGFIKLVKFRPTYIKDLQKKITTVFENCADESKVKIFSAVSVAMLDWNKTVVISTTESCILLRNFLSSVVEPHIAWKAGATAEAMRSLAMATLCALSQGASEEATQVLPSFAKYMPYLLEDQCVSTRRYSIKCLYNFGEIDIEYLKPIAYACLQRLNDPAYGIRIFAASVIPKLKLKINETKNGNDKVLNYESDVWLSFIKSCFDLLYIHYDNPEKSVQSAIGETIIELTKQYPKISKSSYERSLVATHNCYNLKELGNQLSTI